MSLHNIPAQSKKLEISLEIACFIDSKYNYVAPNPEEWIYYIHSIYKRYIKYIRIRLI